MNRRGPGAYREGQAVQFDAGRRGGVVQAVCVEFAGSRWVVRTTDGKTWRVPASMLQPAKLEAGKAAALLDAGRAGEAERDARKARAQARANDMLAPRAAAFRPGQVVEVVHRGSWGWRAEVVRVEGGKVVVTNPTRDLLDRVAAGGTLDAAGILRSWTLPHGRRTRATITLWANRVRLPGQRNDFTLL